MPVLQVRNETPGPLVLVDERYGNREEYQWQPCGTPFDGDLLEVPKELAGNVNFRRNVQKGNLRIVAEIDDAAALMGPSDSDWASRQLAAGGVPTSAIGEAGGVPVYMDRAAQKPIATMTTDEQGNIIDVASMDPEQRQAMREEAGQVPVNQALQERQEQQPAVPPAPPVQNRQPLAPPAAPVVPQVVQEAPQTGGDGTSGYRPPAPRPDPFLAQAPEVPTPGMKQTEGQGEGDQPPPNAPPHLDPNQP